MRFSLDFQFGGGRKLRRKAAINQALSPVMSDARGFWPVIRESFTGAWQQNVEVDFDCAVSFYAFYACATLISNDMGKIEAQLFEYFPDLRIWEPTESPAFSPVLREPNPYQTGGQFREWYTMSKLLRGNVYVLLVPDARGVIVKQLILDPNRTKPFVTPDGAVYYQLGADNLTDGEVMEEKLVPAKFILHDRINCIWHPLVGTSPLYGNGLAAMQGLAIQKNATRFFNNNAQPAGILTAPGHIKKATADRLKETWNSSVGGANYGKLAVLGDDLKYQPIAMSAHDAQMIEQLQLTAKIVCSCFHVPPFKIGLEPVPAQSAEVANMIYYSDCLQSHIEQFESCQDKALGIGKGITTDGGHVYGVGLDRDNLFTMDRKTETDVLVARSRGGLYSPDEARQVLNKRPVPGGSTPYMQQQDFSLEALAKRDAQADPFGTKPAPALPAPPPPDDSADDGTDATQKLLAALRQRFAA